MTFFFQIFSLTVRAAKGICVPKKSSNLAYSLVLALMLLVMGVGSVSGQANGDYRTRYTDGSARNWNTPSNWQIYNGGWNNAAVVPSSTNNVTIRNGSTYSVDVNASCNSLTVTGGGSLTSLSINGTYSLVVTNGVTIGAGTGSGDNIYVAVGTGSLSCGSINVDATGTPAPPPPPEVPDHVEAAFQLPPVTTEK